MNTSQKEIFNRITEAVQASGGRMTTPRIAVIELLLRDHEGRTIQEIVRLCALDEVSVYRNIAYLQSLGFLEEIQLHDGTKKFSITEHHHDHVVCTRCGYVGHIPCSNTSSHQKITHRAFAAVDTHTLTYYGLCKKCVV